MLAGLKVSSLESKCVFYRPKNNAKEGHPEPVGYWATISKMSALENKGSDIFLLTQQFFLYFYPRYLTNGNSKAY